MGFFSTHYNPKTLFQKGNFFQEIKDYLRWQEVLLDINQISSDDLDFKSRINQADELGMAEWKIKKKY